MSRLFIFNPETDYALAHGRRQYTPPKQVVAIRRGLALLPALFADEGDAILRIDDEPLRPEDGFLRVAESRRLRLLRPADLAAESFTQIIPWGWNPALAADLARWGIDTSLIPGDDALAEIRRLAHRRLTVPFLTTIKELVPGALPDVLPIEISDLQQLEGFLRRFPAAYLKAPWSSSGRGVVCTSTMSPQTVNRWTDGIIRSQGSLMAEPAVDRIADFATEWSLSNGHALFIGLSVFSTSGGQYNANVADSTDNLLAILRDKGVNLSSGIIDAQRVALEKLVAHCYSGRVGIDMLADRQGRINSCVEVNLRHTMGMAAVAVYRLTGRRQEFNPFRFAGL